MPAWARHGLYIRIRPVVRFPGNSKDTRYNAYIDRYQIPRCYSLLRVIMGVGFLYPSTYFLRVMMLLSVYIHVDDYMYYSVFFFGPSQRFLLLETQNKAR